MELYQASPEAILRSRSLFSNIFKELNKESKNFSPELIEEKSKTRDFATAIQWLSMAHIVNQSFQLKEHITVPLMPENENNFRRFLGDIGMFSNHNKFEYAIKISQNNYGYHAEQKLLTIAFYFIPFAAKSLADGTMTI